MTAILIALMIIIALCLLILFLIFPATRRHPDRKILSGLYIAHRGLHDIDGSGEENSLPAFRFAAENGFAAENDIHLTADGEVVVFHDDTLDRMCGVSGKVEEKTLSELKKLRLGGTDEQIPTLKECLDVVGGRVPMLIEFKVVDGNHKALCAAADKILSDYKGKYFIQSFYPSVLTWYKANRPDICRGQLAEVFGSDKPAFYKLLSCLITNVVTRPDFVSYNFMHKNFFFRRLAVWLGAFSVGWTFRKKEQVAGAKQDFATYIFENFLPDSVCEEDKKC